MPLPKLEIEEEKSDSRLVLAVSGEIDMATVDGLRDALARAPDGARDVWVDLTDVDFMDSTGITALMRAHQAIGDGYRRFTIICPGEGPVYRALEICGLHEVLRVYPSRAAASA